MFCLARDSHYSRHCLISSIHTYIHTYLLHNYCSLTGYTRTARVPFACVYIHKLSYGSAVYMEKDCLLRRCGTAGAGRLTALSSPRSQRVPYRKISRLKSVIAMRPPAVPPRRHGILYTYVSCCHGSFSIMSSTFIFRYIHIQNI